jgi:hypothetical protein
MHLVCQQEKAIHLSTQLELVAGTTTLSFLWTCSYHLKPIESNVMASGGAPWSDPDGATTLFPLSKAEAEPPSGRGSHNNEVLQTAASKVK